jgi:hypothetical protein
LLALSDNAEPVTALKYDATIKAMKIDHDKNKAASNLKKQKKRQINSPNWRIPCRMPQPFVSPAEA